jgi:hypothetical protein
MSNLSILTPNEQQAFDYPPTLPVEIQTICFSITSALEKEINNLKTPVNKVGFLLQYAYFKACKRFFIINRFTKDQIRHAAMVLNIAPPEMDLASYKKKMPIEHQKKILKFLNYKSFNHTVIAWLKEEILRWIQQQIGTQANFYASAWFTATT